MSDSDLYEALLQTICDEPYEPIHKLAMADYFGECGDELKQASWQGLRDKTPFLMDYSTYGSDHPHLPFPYWWLDFGINNRLPDDWLAAIVDDDDDNTRGNKFFRTIRSAFTKAVDGFVRWKEGKT